MVKVMAAALMEVVRAMVVLLLAMEDNQIVIASLHRQHMEASRPTTVMDSRLLLLRIQLGMVTRLQLTEWGLVLLMVSNRAAVLMVSRGPMEASLKTPAAVAMEGGGMTAKAAAAAAAGMAETTVVLTAPREAATGGEGEEEAAAMAVTVAEDMVVTVAEEEDTAAAVTVAMVAATAAVAAATSAAAGMTAVEEADLLVWEVVTVVATKISVALETTVQGMNHPAVAAGQMRTTRTTTRSLFKDCQRMSQLSKWATISNRLVSSR